MLSPEKLFPANTSNPERKLTMPFHVGQPVRAARDITHDADEAMPAQLFAEKGTPLIVREVGSGRGWAYFVANPAFKPDTAFGVEANEIEAF
jgi:hypothetical protein